MELPGLAPRTQQLWWWQQDWKIIYNQTNRNTKDTFQKQNFCCMMLLINLRCLELYLRAAQLMPSTYHWETSLVAFIDDSGFVFHLQKENWYCTKATEFNLLVLFFYWYFSHFAALNASLNSHHFMINSWRRKLENLTGMIAECTRKCPF